MPERTYTAEEVDAASGGSIRVDITYDDGEAVANWQAGDYDLLVKFYVDKETDIGHFVNEKVQVLPGIQDTRTIITFKAFSAG